MLTKELLEALSRFRSVRDVPAPDLEPRLAHRAHPNRLPDQRDLPLGRTKQDVDRASRRYRIARHDADARERQVPNVTRAATRDFAVQGELGLDAGPRRGAIFLA